jgi:hypothetical protein
MPENTPPIYVDLEQTQRRIALLQQYVQHDLLSEGEFICDHYNACAASVPGYHDFREGITTILIFQGRPKAAANWTEILTVSDTIKPGLLYEAHLDDVRTLVCTLSHPSAHADLRWGANLDAEYLTGTVEPTLREAISLI